MKAVQLVAHGVPGVFKLREVPDPVPKEGEVVVAVQACGLNHLDLWFEEGALPIKVQLPRTPGCEIAGTVMDTGRLPAGLRAGDRVAVQSNITCGECEYCQRGEESSCLKSQMLGVERDGGFAERVLVPGASVVKLPEGVDFQTAAGLTLAGSTAMHMLTDRVQVQPGMSVLIIGAASGVGSAAIQIARQLGARVLATASSPQKRDLALKIGAEHVVDQGDAEWPAKVRQLTAKKGVDIVIEHIGGKVLEQSLEALARGGTIVTCGATGGRNVQLKLWPFFVKQHRLVGSYSRNRADLVRTLEWADQGRLTPIINRVFPLDDTPSAFAALRDRTVLGKVIVKTQ